MRAAAYRISCPTPIRIVHDPNKAPPLFIGHNGDGDPSVITKTAVDAVGRSVVASVSLESQLAVIGLVVQNQRRHIIQTCFNLSMVDVLALAGASPVIEEAIMASEPYIGESWSV